jgi:phage terminase large subunit-like protein
VTATATVTGWPPLICTPVPQDEIERGDGAKVCELIETLCRVTKDGYACRAGDPIELLGFQRELLARLFARRVTGRLRHRVALVGMPRRNGKSTLAGGLALHGLLLSGGGAEVYSAAVDKQQARIVFSDVARMIEFEPTLSKRLRVFRDAIEFPGNGSVYRVLSADAFSAEGLNISRAIVDELHAHRSDDLWNVLTLASGSRVDPLVIAITTAGVMTDRMGRDTVCYRLAKHGADVADGHAADDTFFCAWWGAPAGADHTSPEVWTAANPAYGTLIDPEDFASAVKRTPENEYRAKRLNQWVASKSAWLPAGLFESRTDADRELKRGEAVVLAVDASMTNDSTVIVCATVAKPHYVQVLGAWERPGDDPDWRVPFEEVKDALRAAHKQYKVRRIVYDPRYFEATAQELAAEGLRMVMLPQSVARLEAATKKAFDMVAEGKMSHSGHAVLVSHARNAIVKVGTDGGQRIVKDAKSSGRKVDAAQAMTWALDGASVEKVGLGYVVDLSTVVDAEEAAEIAAWADRIAAGEPEPEEIPI